MSKADKKRFKKFFNINQTFLLFFIYYIKAIFKFKDVTAISFFKIAVTTHFY